jgi:hypothetical protein
MAKILAESLVVLEADANRLSMARKRMTERMRIEIWQTSRLERLPEDRADWSRSPPSSSLETIDSKPSAGAAGNPRLREQRIVRPPKQRVPKMPDPTLKDFPEIIADGNEIGRKRLREFRPHVSRVLMDEPSIEIDVPQQKRGESVAPRTGHKRKRYQGAISLFDVSPARHSERDVPDLLDRWDRPPSRSFRDRHVLR